MKQKHAYNMYMYCHFVINVFKVTMALYDITFLLPLFSLSAKTFVTY